MLHRRDPTSHLLLIIVYSLVFCSGCAFPRIVVLDDPLTPEEHLTLGVAYERKGELDSAIKEYELGAKKLSIAYMYLGNAYFQKETLGEAEKYYRLAIENEILNADAHNNLAWLYYVKKENLDEAESLVLKAIELNPSKNDIYGDTLKRIKGLKEAGR